jgi:asparagine synthase (glutamine-hydrolysing)
MCGLAGIVTSDDAGGASLRNIANRMVNTLQHRGPDDSGVWADEAAGVALAHRRLSILDLTPAGHQPMQAASGRYLIVFNGEIYNHHEIRRELVGEGINTWRGHSDTETLLAAFDAWGVEAALKKTIGMFALAVWDRQTRELKLARDRFGEKPLYYGWVDRTFVFASELSAIRAHPGFHSDVDRGALTLLLRHGYVPTPYSIFQGISKLSPGTILTLDYRNHQTRIEPYWSLRAVAESGVGATRNISQEMAVEELEALLKDAIAKQIVADVPLGAFLSGGVDSSLVVALMQAQTDRPVNTFTIGFFEDSHNEAQYAKAVAHHLGTTHTEYYVSPAEMLAVIPRLPDIYDEPFADSSQVPTFLVSQLARRHVTVSLTGDGADELFGGYGRYISIPSYWRRLNLVPAFLRSAVAQCVTAMLSNMPSHIPQFVAAFMPNRLRHANLGNKLDRRIRRFGATRPEEIYLDAHSFLHSPEKAVIGGMSLPTALTDPECWPALPELVQRIMYLDQTTYLPDDLLVKMDRAAMHTSLETRAPCLDHRIAEFVWQLPDAMKFRGLQGKWLLRQVLYKYVPRNLVDRPKMGFSVPLHLWLRGPLREWAESMIDEKRLIHEGFFYAAPIRELWLEFLAGNDSVSYCLWNILMFQAWLAAGKAKPTRESIA